MVLGGSVSQNNSHPKAERRKTMQGKLRHTMASHPRPPTGTAGVKFWRGRPALVVRVTNVVSKESSSQPAFPPTIHPDTHMALRILTCPVVLACLTQHRCHQWPTRGASQEPQLEQQESCIFERPKTG
eukprot:scaffold139206_cov17-Tisochrysis_lutea.AAC.1